MSAEKPSPFCPSDCVFLKETDEVFHRGCGHLEDIVVDPSVPAETKTKPIKTVKIVGANPKDFYIEEESYSGRKSIFSVFKEAVVIKKKK